jgi:hypothetical protein
MCFIHTTDPEIADLKFPCGKSVVAPLQLPANAAVPPANIVVALSVTVCNSRVASVSSLQTLIEMKK